MNCGEMLATTRKVSRCANSEDVILTTCPLRFLVFVSTEPKSSVKPLAHLQKAASGAAAAALIASSVLSWAPPPADASFAFSSSQVVAEKVTREGVYGEYEVDVPNQVYDDARSTFKSAKETKTKKGKFRREAPHCGFILPRTNLTLSFDSLALFIRKVYRFVGCFDCR